MFHLVVKLQAFSLISRPLLNLVLTWLISFPEAKKNVKSHQPCDSNLPFPQGLGLFPTQIQDGHLA